jgi:hypothetical protein
VEGVPSRGFESVPLVSDVIFAPGAGFLLITGGFSELFRPPSSGVDDTSVVLGDDSAGVGDGSSGIGDGSSRGALLGSPSRGAPGS